MHQIIQQFEQEQEIQEKDSHIQQLNNDDIIHPPIKYIVTAMIAIVWIVTALSVINTPSSITGPSTLEFETASVQDSEDTWSQSLEDLCILEWCERTPESDNPNQGLCLCVYNNEEG